MASQFDALRQVERRELDRLEAYLAALDVSGWQEQSYDADWRVYQVISHLASQSLIYLGFLASWFDGSLPLSRERMQMIWDKFNALGAIDMLPEFRDAKQRYLTRLEGLPPDAGTREVDSPIGKAKAEMLLAMRLHEVALHSWDVYVARDRKAVIPDDVVNLVLPVQLHIRTMRKPAALDGKRVQLQTPDGWQRVVDFKGATPAIEEASAGGADITVQAPAEEICRLLGGRHHVPGSLSRLTWDGGSYQELTALSLFAG